ncbi:MAG: hypothetical protein HQL84_11765 [Magnetococcales bacterium]|nr:hypothetical protein [Magnetococcales bacterium]MBF0150712.1 hypothetical protein [Magnetococcales bacterium]
MLGVCIALNHGTEGHALSAFGLPIHLVAHAEFTHERHGKEIKLLKEEMDRILMETAPVSVFFQDFLSNGHLSLLGRILMDRGGKAIPVFTQIVDLTVGEDRLRQGLTKTYKWCVNWGIKNLELTILDHQSITLDHMESFRQLHFNASGRTTHSHKSWMLQFDLVKQKEAFVVFGAMEGELVTASLFIHNQKHYFYGVSASKRELFDKSLYHCIIWKGMLHAHALGVEASKGPLSRLGSGEVWNLIHTWNHLVADRREKLALLKPFIPSWLPEPDMRLPCVVPISIDPHQASHLTALGINSGFRHYERIHADGRRELVKMFPIPIHQDVSMEWLLKVRTILESF